MDKGIAVKNKTELSPVCQKQDILALYGVPSMLDEIAKKEKDNLFSMLTPSFVLADSLNEISHAGGFVVNIPKGMEDALRSGVAHLDKSSKDIGAFTPNIRINGETGIKGQLTISNGVDSQAVMHSLSNLAMMAMLQNVLSKLDDLEEKQNEILKGQENDRIGSIIGAYKAFKDLVNNKDQDSIKTLGESCYKDIQEGLAQLNLQIEEERKKLANMPSTYWQVFIKSFFSTHTVLKPEIYEKFVYDIQLYCRLLLLSDVVALRIGKGDTIPKNHEVIEEYCSQHLSVKFQKHMKFLTNGHVAALDKINRFNQYCSSILIAISQNGISIECKPEDIKLLK